MFNFIKYFFSFSFLKKKVDNNIYTAPWTAGLWLCFFDPELSFNKWGKATGAWRACERQGNENLSIDELRKQPLNYYYTKRPF